MKYIIYGAIIQFIVFFIVIKVEEKVRWEQAKKIEQHRMSEYERRLY